MKTDIVKEKKKSYLLLIGLGIAAIIFLLTLATLTKEEEGVKLPLVVDLRSAKKGKKIFSFRCGEKIIYQGEIYKTVKIGDQCWLAENLKARNYRNGTPILNAKSKIEWKKAKNGAFCCYENSFENCKKYGALYNWEVVKNPAGICPEGWKVPSHQDWAKLERTICKKLGYGNCRVPFAQDSPFGWRGRNEGKHLKSEKFKGFNTFGLNFTLGGFRTPEGSFRFFEKKGAFWTLTHFSEDFAYARMLDFEKDQIRRFSAHKKNGFSIRCLKE